MLIELLSVLTVGIIVMIAVIGYQQSTYDLSVDLNEAKPVSAKVTLTTAVRSALAHLEHGKVEDVYYGIGSFGVKASRTKIRRQLRAMRDAGKVALNFSNGRGEFSLAA